MRIYDGSEVDVDLYTGDVLLGHGLGDTSFEMCPFCGKSRRGAQSQTEAVCSQCGAEYKKDLAQQWCWERNVQGESINSKKKIVSLEEKIHLRDRQVRSLRRALRKES